MKFVCRIMVVLLLSGTYVMAEESDIRLDEVVVTATRTERDLRDVTQSVTVITSEEIEQSGATTVADVLRPRISMIVQEYGSQGALSQLSIRGSSAEQVLILLDEKRLNSPRDGVYDLSDLPVSLDDIERIEILRGSSSALYGADAVGGVVNIITKQPKKSITSVSGSIGSNGYDDLSFRYSGKKGRLYYALSAARETYDGFRVNSDLDKGVVGTKIGYNITPVSFIELTADYSSKEVGVPGSTAFLTPEARQWSRDTITGLRYRTKISNELDLTAKTYYKGNDLTYKLNSADPGSNHDSSSQVADAQMNWIPNSWNVFTGGVEFRGDDVNGTDTGEHASRLWAGYLQDELSLGESVIVVAGVRYDDHSIYGDESSPRVSARYYSSQSGTIIRMSAGEGFRAPTFNELYWSDAWGNVGNPNLVPETSREYEAGIEQTVGRSLILKLTGFQRKVDNLITWREYVPFQYTPENIGRADIAGREMEMKIAAFRVLTWVINYSYINPVDETTGEKIYTIPEIQLDSHVNLAFATKTNVYIEGRMVKYYQEPNEDEWKYFVMDGKISQAVSFGQNIKGDVFFGMKNIFDRAYEVVEGYPMPPQEIYGGLAVRF